ncbi:hypothetical protein BDR22DRAFT_518371 [Usnea florida]
MGRAVQLSTIILALFTSICISKPASGRRAIFPREFCPSNNTHTVTANETCTTISVNEGVSTSDIIALNCLDSQCTNLKVNSTIQLPGQCDTITVEAGDTCTSIVSGALNNLTLPNFFLFNPSLHNDCSNLLAGDNVCISAPTCSAFYPSNCIAQNSTVPSSGPAPGTNATCVPLHTAVPDDNCNKIAQEYNITVSQFLQTNPSVYQNCTNLVAGAEYCVSTPSS